MYSEMVFVTLDIDEFAHWASRFVPRDYHAKHAFGKYFYSLSALRKWGSRDNERQSGKEPGIEAASPLCALALTLLQKLLTDIFSNIQKFPGYFENINTFKEIHGKKS